MHKFGLIIRMVQKMLERTFYCDRCRTHYEFCPRFEPCEVCGDPLTIEFDIQKAHEEYKRQNSSPKVGITRFYPFLPFPDDLGLVSLGEGNTPLVKLRQLNRRVGIPNLHVKNESGNPSWSFKDRLNFVNATFAKASGFKDIVATSTGNHGASAAAYASAAGLRSTVLFPHGTPDVYVRQVESYGGRAILTDWHKRSGILTSLVREEGFYPSKSSLPTPISNPIGLEGYKTIAYELANETKGDPLEYVFVPVGSGDDLFGIYRGFEEFLKLGLIRSMPKFVGCEADGSCPLYKAFEAKSSRITKIDQPRTIATSISEGIVSNLALRAINGSQGQCAVVSDTEILEAGRDFASCGLFAESSSCVGLASAKRFVADGKLALDAKIVVILTATGLRWPSVVT